VSRLAQASAAASSWTQARLDWLADRDKRAAAKRGRTLGEALRDGPAVVRIEYPFDRNGRRIPHLTAWTAAPNCRRIWLDEKQETAILAEVTRRHPLADPRVDHDYHLADGALYAAPDVMDSRGGIPEQDHCYGTAPPVYLPTPTANGAT
jgi:hypothetical protein